jgi:O-methyltransferase domain
MSERPPEEIVWNLMRGALAARVLGIVADLRVADALAVGPRRVEEVAREVGVDGDTLHRFLRALATDAVFAEEEPGVFRNTPASELLRREGSRNFAHLFGGVFHRTAGELDASGEPVFARLFGAEFWEWLAAHPDERASFDRAMAGGKEWKADRLAGIGWRDGETVVDVGGGNGALLRELLRRRPGLRGIVFDLPETERDESAFGDRLEFVAGSFFDRVPAGDTYLLSAILHDWNDERATAILRTIRASAPSDARVLVAETVITHGNEPSGSKWLDLLMLALLDGRERDESQWRALIESAGLRPVTVEDGLIEARCP